MKFQLQKQNSHLNLPKHIAKKKRKIEFSINININMKKKLESTQEKLNLSHKLHTNFEFVEGKKAIILIFFWRSLLLSSFLASPDFGILASNPLGTPTIQQAKSSNPLGADLNSHIKHFGQFPRCS